MNLTATAGLSKLGLRLILAAAVAGAFGVVTEWSVPHLPNALEPLANTAAPWVLVAFLLALPAVRIGEAVLLAFVALIVLTLGFYAAQAFRGWSVSEHQVVFWCISSLVFGPLVGCAAGWLRYRGVVAGALGAGLISGLLVGEAIHGLTEEKYWTPGAYWHVQIAVGIGLAIAMTLWSARRRLWAAIPALAVSAAACAVVGAATVLAYQVS